MPNVDSDIRPIYYSPAVWLATGGGIGLVAPAPGTAGALVWGLPLSWSISLLPEWGWQLAVVAMVNLLGVPLCTRAERDLGGRKDNQSIVWDEIVTVPLAFLAVPLANWRIGLVGFLLVRVFDIVKPPPIRQLERLPSGLGIMVDDLVAGLWACLLLFLLVQTDLQAGTEWLVAGRG